MFEKFEHREAILDDDDNRRNELKDVRDIQPVSNMDANWKQYVQKLLSMKPHYLEDEKLDIQKY
jgi:hypothetical protein